jgi:hypothetical protein
VSTYSLSHLSDPVLLRGLTSLVAQDRATTAALLAHIAEVDARRLYLPAAYPSMFLYCVEELHLSEDAASKRIQAARVARRFPAIFDAIAQGRLHLSAVVLLAPHLTEGTVDDLVAAATHLSKSGIERLLAERFPRTDVLAWTVATPLSSDLEPVAQHAPGHVEDARTPGRPGEELQHAPGHVGDRPRVSPLSAQSFAVQFTMTRCAHDKLRYAQELLGHQIPSGEIAAVFERALDSLIGQLEKRKFAAITHPPRGGRPSGDPRHIPAHVKRAVWERDGGQCTFVSVAGRRCPSRTRLEFDHVVEVARGGEASVAGIRLRCRAHNQYGAECAFGAGFMREKREAAQRAAEARRKETEARAADEERREAAKERVRAVAQEVIAPLRALGFRADEAQCAASLCETIPDAPLEQRVRRALSYFHRPPAPADPRAPAAPA